MSRKKRSIKTTGRGWLIPQDEGSNPTPNQVLQDQLRELANLVLDIAYALPSEDFLSVFGDTLKSEFDTALTQMSDDERLGVEERAAIYEFDAGMSKDEAEKRALNEYYYDKED